MNAGLAYWRTGHCCRACLGPVLKSDVGFTCAVCDAASESVEGICGCGIRVAGLKASRAMFQCAPNPARGPASPAGVVIVFKQADALLLEKGQ